MKEQEKSETSWHQSPIKQAMTDALRREYRPDKVVGNADAIIRLQGHTEGFIAALALVDNFQSRHDEEPTDAKKHIPYSGGRQPED